MTNPITSFETMLVFIDLANDYCHIKIKMKHLFLLNKYTHGLRQLTLCLHCFGFTLVPDWNNWVQKLPIMLIFLSWKNGKKRWKSIVQIAKSLRASGHCPEPPLLPSAKPRALFWELNPICMGSSAPTTLAHGTGWHHLCLFGTMVQNFLLTNDHWQQKQIFTLQNGIDLYSCQIQVLFLETLVTLIRVGLRKSPHFCTTKLGHMFYQTMPV